MWKIEKDHIGEEGINRVGTSGEIINIGLSIAPEMVDLPEKGLPLIKFRLYDDDGELYYEGVLHDDNECLNQQAALTYGMIDAGCTTIKVKRGRVWTQDIS